MSLIPDSLVSRVDLPPTVPVILGKENTRKYSGYRVFSAPFYFHGY